MMTVNDVSKLTGVSVRTLHYYDQIGLLSPVYKTKAGYRLYDNTSLEKLQQILIFKELEFSLNDIKKIIDSPNFEIKKALSKQIELLSLKKEHFENLILFAKKLQTSGGNIMNFKAFDKEKIERYKNEAKKAWGNTAAYREYQEKITGYSDEKQELLAMEMMNIFNKFGENINKTPNNAYVQKLVKDLQDFITANYYTCTKQILSGLGQMYASGGEIAQNIDAAGGIGTSLFVANAIKEFCK